MTSATSTNSSTLFSQSTSSSPLSPLIKLERLVYRLNSIISINLDSFNEFELKNRLKLLLEYQKEISKLKEIVDENLLKIKSEFEFENRIQWIDNRIELLNKIIKELETADKDDKEKDKSEILEEVTDDHMSEIVEGYTDEIATEAIVSEDITTTTQDTLINEILPPKPETLLSLPKSIKSPTPESEKEKEKDSLVFSEEIQSEHNNLTNELIATVQLIKRNNLHIQKMVKSDDKIITEATGLLATNSDAMHKEGKNLKSYSKTAWVSFWKMLGILFFVCFTFIFVYIFIRLT